jgi:SAM-dependent methyltransferase
MQRFGPVHRHTMENLSRAIGALEVRTILDVGCGSGENLAALARSGRYDLAGVDVSAEALALATKRVPGARFRLLDIEQEPLPERFDLVMSIQVAEHLLDDVAAFTSMAKMARTYVLVSTMQGRMRPSEVAIGHVRNYSRVELRCKLEHAGLEVLWTRGWGFPFYSPIVRSLVEWLPGGPPGGPMGGASRALARLLYALYRFNVPGRGDVLTALARVR